MSRRVNTASSPTAVPARAADPTADSLDEAHSRTTGPADAEPSLDPQAHEELAAALAAGTTEHYLDAALYDHEYRRRRDDVAWYRRLAAEVAATTVAAPAALRILELGCGTGRLLVPLVRDGHLVWGVDRSRTMLARLRDRMGRLSTRARARAFIIQSDFRGLPLDGALRFPLITCPFNGFQHLYSRADVERFLGEVKRLLAPGGLFAFDVTHPDPRWLARDPEKRYSRTRFRHPSTGERLIYSTSHFYEPATQLCWMRIFYDPAPETAAAGDLDGSSTGKSASRGRPESAAHSVLLTHRLFFPAELDALLHYSGFEVISHQGGFDGGPLGTESNEQVICARVR